VFQLWYPLHGRLIVPQVWSGRACRRDSLSPHRNSSLKPSGSYRGAISITLSRLPVLT